MHAFNKQIALFVIGLEMSFTLMAAENFNQLSIKSDLTDAQKTRFQPGDLYKTSYRGQVVYYITSVCCDIPARLMDEKGMLVCYPNGGFISVDKKCPDFILDRSKAVKLNDLPEYMSKKRGN